MISTRVRGDGWLFPPFPEAMSDQADCTAALCVVEYRGAQEDHAVWHKTPSQRRGRAAATERKGREGGERAQRKVGDDSN